MSVSVRVRDHEKLRDLIAAYVACHGSARRLADACGMSYGLLSMLRTGKHDTLSLDLASRVEAELGAEPGALFAMASTSDISPYLTRPAAHDATAGDAGRRHPDWRRPA